MALVTIYGPLHIAMAALRICLGWPQEYLLKIDSHRFHQLRHLIWIRWWW